MVAGTVGGSALAGGLAGRLAHKEEEGKQAAFEHYKVAFAAPLLRGALSLGKKALPFAKDMALQTGMQMGASAIQNKLQGQPAQGLA
jgi:hypothetical protein